MTTLTTINNNRAMFIAAHAEAHRLRENWPNVMYSELFRDALRRVWAAVIATRAAVAAGLIAATKKGIAGCVRAFRAIANRINNQPKESTMSNEQPVQDAAKMTIAPYCKLWKKDTRRRFYVNRAVSILRDYCDAKIEYHRTGSYKSIEICGCEYSNRYGAKMIEAVRNSYFDIVSGEWHFDEEVADDIRAALTAIK